VDLEAVNAASAPALVKCATEAAANAQGLLDDAELLAAAGRNARAYALAALAVEEAGKACGLSSLALMPRHLRAKAPVGRLLWHQLKLVGGIVLAAAPHGGPGKPTLLGAMPPNQVAGILEDARVLAEDVDRLKQRGLYADIECGGQVRAPSQVSQADVPAQLGRARRAVSSVSVLLGPGAPAAFSNPPAESVQFALAMVSALAEAGYGRTPQDAAAVMLDAVRKFQQTAASGSSAQSGPAGSGT
jgi:AbiV family abortive infection protein